MKKQLVEIDEETFKQLEAVARENGFNSVEEFLTEFAYQFSRGCSVTLAGSAQRVA